MHDHFLLSPAFFLLPLLGFAPLGAADQPPAALPGYEPGGGITADSVAGIVEWAMARYEVPGAAVAVVRDGEVLMAKGFGVRNTDTGEAVDAHTLFQLASVSKTFTAAAFAAAVGDEKLTWEEPASQVLPDFQMSVPYATDWANGTDFLVHRAGFPGFFGDLFDHFGYSRADIVHRVRFVEPGYSFRDHPEYSNIGFFLAGEMVATVRGVSFEQAVRDSILKPLGMNETGRAADLVGPGKSANAAIGHTVKNGETVTVPHNLSKVFVAAGGLVSNATDLASYLQMLLSDGKFHGKTVLASEALEQMLEPVIASEVGFSEFPPISPQSGFDYTPGWGVFHYNGLKVFEKGGALDGVRTVAILVPEKKFGIAVLANMNLTALPEAVRAGVLQQMFGRPDEEDLQPAIFERAQKLHEMLFGAMKEPDVMEGLAPAQIEALTGNYVNDLFGVWSVKRSPDDDSQLTLVCGPASYRGILEPESPDTLFVRWPILISGPDELAFEIPENGPAEAFTFEGYRFRRLP